MSVSRWMNWTPEGEAIIGNSPRRELTKPSKPSSVSFGGAIHANSQEIGEGIPRAIIEKSPQSELTEPPKPNSLSEADAWMWIQERSAIMEIDGGFTREQADVRAFSVWFERFVGDNKP